jgi:23S rRNA (uridine2552-2'-O)-methyltransferase
MYVGTRRLFSQWYQRQVKDQFVREARAQDYRSRAAFKLLQIQAAYRVLRPGHRVVDLGAAPGGWSQVSRGLVGSKGRVVGVDLFPVSPIDGIEFVQGDFLETQDRLMDKIGRADVVLSYSLASRL